MSSLTTNLASPSSLPGSQLKVIFSDRACCSITSETLHEDPNETGGILLGHYSNNTWYVIEAIDPGPNSLFTPYTFEYDTSYVNHLAKKMSSLYCPHLKLLGLWHRHPGSLDTFSGADDDTNQRYASTSNFPIISCIVNLDPFFRLTAYYAPRNLAYQKVAVSFDCREIGNEFSKLRHTTPLDGSCSSDSILDILYQKLFALNYTPSSPLHSDMGDVAEKVLLRLDALSEFTYGVKACGKTLQIALVQIAGCERHLLEIIRESHTSYRVVLDNKPEPGRMQQKRQISSFSLLTFINFNFLSEKEPKTIACSCKEIRELVANLTGDISYA